MLRALLITLEIVIGVGAVGGGIYALVGAKSVPREHLEGTPFRSYFVPGLVLLVVVGGSMLLAATLLLLEAPLARVVSLEAGVILLVWIGVQVSLIGYRHWLQPLMAALGLAIVVLSFFLPAPG
jgi:hypothetical protein